MSDLVARAIAAQLKFRLPLFVNRFFAVIDHPGDAETLDYLSFPALTILPNGNLMACWRAGSTHGYDINGKIVGAISSNGGVSWPRRTTIIDTASVDDRNPAMVTLDNGTVLLAYNTYNNTDSRVYVVKSTDNGATWGSPSLIANIEGRTRGHLRELSNGTILLPFYDAISTIKKTYVAKSTDGGTNWSVIQVTDAIGDEFSIIELKTNGQFAGEIIGYIRDNSTFGFKQVRSSNYGETWSAPVDAPLPLQMEWGASGGGMINGGVPIDIQRLSDDRIIAMYTRSSGKTIDIFVSSDECNSWSGPYTLYYNVNNFLVGYPMFVEYAGGLFTIWYENPKGLTFEQNYAYIVGGQWALI